MQNKGTHNSLSSYSLLNWWVTPFALFAKCQSLTLEEQLEAGVIYFDLRFRKVGGKLYGAHGVAIYDITIEQVFNILNGANKTIYVRCIVEDGLFEDDLTVEHLFSEVCRLKGDNIVLTRIGLKSNWANHAILVDVPTIGKVDYKLNEISEKAEEMQTVSRATFLKPTVYEIFTYKGVIPKLANYLLNRKTKSLKFNTNLIIFRDYVTKQD